MKRFKIYLYLVAMALLVGCGPSDRALKIAKISGDSTLGEMKYNEMCARCHGADGRGGRGLNLIKHRRAHDDAELIDTILEGGNGMPTFKHLEDQTIADIISHIRAL